MKKIFLIAAALILSVSGYCQMAFSIAVPQQDIADNKDHLTMLKTKLTSAMSGVNVRHADYCPIVVIPTTVVADKNTIEGGMKTITVYDIELNLSVRHIILGTGFAETSIQLRGEGYSEQQAIMSALRKLTVNDPRLKQFFSDAAKKVTDYYKTQIQSIINQANTFAVQQKYGTALALLECCPKDIEEYDKVLKAMEDIYKQYQTKNCTQILQTAKGYMAMREYESALSLLTTIDTQSSCSSDASACIKDIENKIRKEIEKQEAIEKQERANEFELKKQAISAVESVAKAYLQKQPNYFYIVK